MVSGVLIRNGEQMAKTIGETNGVWGYLFKFALATVPLWFAWMAWMTVNQVLDNSFRGAGPRFTAAQAKSQVELIVARIEPRLVRIETQLNDQDRIRPSDVYHLVEELKTRLDKDKE